jgi:hypothetical protein
VETVHREIDERRREHEVERERARAMVREISADHERAAVRQEVHLGVEFAAGVACEPGRGRQEARDLGARHHDLGREQPGSEALRLLRAEALAGEAHAVFAKHARMPRALREARRERARRVEVEEVHEQIRARVLRVGRRRRAQFRGADDARPRQLRGVRQRARLRAPLARRLVLPHATRVVHVRRREQLHVRGARGVAILRRGVATARVASAHPIHRRERVGLRVERQQERADRGSRLDGHGHVQHEPHHALAAREIGERHRLKAARAEPQRALVAGQRATLVAFVRHVEPAVVVEAHVLAVRQQHVGGAHGVERAATPVRVHANAAGHEPADERAAQVRRVGAQREAARGELGVHVAHARAGADHGHAGPGLDVHEVEARQVEREPGVVRHRAAHGGRRRAAQRHRHLRVARPAQRLRALAERRRLEDQIGHGLGQRAGEQRTQVHVLVAVRLAAQQRVGDDALAQRARVGVGLGAQRGVERLRQLAAARRSLTLAERDAFVEEIVEVGDAFAHRTGALIGRQLAERVERLADRLLEKGVGHPGGFGEGVRRRPVSHGSAAFGARSSPRVPTRREGTARTGRL